MRLDWLMIQVRVLSGVPNIMSKSFSKFQPKTIYLNDTLDFGHYLGRLVTSVLEENHNYFKFLKENGYRLHADLQLAIKVKEDREYYKLLAEIDEDVSF